MVFTTKLSIEDYYLSSGSTIIPPTVIPGVLSLLPTIQMHASERILLGKTFIFLEGLGVIKKMIAPVKLYRKNDKLYYTSFIEHCEECSPCETKSRH